MNNKFVNLTIVTQPNKPSLKYILVSLNSISSRMTAFPSRAFLALLLIMTIIYLLISNVNNRPKRPVPIRLNSSKLLATSDNVTYELDEMLDVFLRSDLIEQYNVFIIDPKILVPLMPLVSNQSEYDKLVKNKLIPDNLVVDTNIIQFGVFSHHLRVITELVNVIPSN